MKIKTIATANSNFYSLSGNNILKNEDSEYALYRKQWEENPKNFILSPFPLSLAIEITNRCNLKCLFCDKLPHLKKEDFGDMEFSLYKKIIDEGKENKLPSIKLSYRGEPLMHKKIADMVYYAKKAGILDVYFNTNGMLLNDEIVLKLIDAGLDRISISIEGTDKKFYETQRKGANFDTLLKKIINLKNLREKKNSPFPKIRIQTVKLKHINLKKYAAFWQEFCDEVAAIDFQDTTKRKKNISAKKWACPHLWQRMTIEWNGKTIPCNNDDSELFYIGNAKKDSIKKMWNLNSLNKIREKHKNGLSHLVEYCDGCAWRFVQINK